MLRNLREVGAEPVAEVARRHGISEQTLYTWRKKYGGVEAADLRRLRQLEKENARLKKLLAERDMEIDVIKDVVKGIPDNAGQTQY